MLPDVKHIRAISFVPVTGSPRAKHLLLFFISSIDKTAMVQKKKKIIGV